MNQKGWEDLEQYQTKINENRWALGRDVEEEMEMIEKG